MPVDLDATLLKRQLALFAPIGSGPDWGRFGMCPMLQYLLLARADMATVFDMTTPTGLADAIAWMFVQALPQYEMEDTVDQATLQALNAPVSWYPTAPKGQPSQSGEGEHAVELSMLMALVWRHRADVRPLYDISSSPGRAKFLLWFVTHAVPEMGLQRLVSEQWRHWLTTVPTHSPYRRLPRLGVLSWIARDDLQQAFDLTSALGQDHLAAWTADSLENQPAWRWLTLPQQQATALAPRRNTWLARPLAARGVNLIGFARGELGIGEDVRMAVAACQAAGIDYSVVNIGTGPRTRQTDELLQADIAAGSAAPYPINIFCLTAFETVQTYLRQGPQLFRQRHNIGWWPWELPVWPDKWRAAFDLVDEVWAASRFTQDLYGSISDTPTYSMPLPVDVSRMRTLSRTALGLPPRRFLFLYVFDFNSYMRRKNPIAALKAFERAFLPEDGSVGLVLKAMNGDPADRLWRHFKRECAKDRRVIVLEETLDRGAVLALVQACDAYVSLHRSEGFGRTLAEAMLFGKPVVGTNFSGNVDFLTARTGFPVQWRRTNLRPGDYPFVEPSDGAWWAEPDIADAATQMRAARLAAKNAAFVNSVQRFATHQFSPKRIGELMKRRLLQITV